VARVSYLPPPSPSGTESAAPLLALAVNAWRRGGAEGVRVLDTATGQARFTVRVDPGERLPGWVALAVYDWRGEADLAVIPHPIT
jgi:hypothetical protein